MKEQVSEQEFKEIERLRKAIANAKEYDEHSVAVRVDLLESFLSTIEAQAKELELMKQRLLMPVGFYEGYEQLREELESNQKVLERLKEIEAISMVNALELSEIHNQLSKTKEEVQKEIGEASKRNDFASMNILESIVSLLQGKEQKEPMD